MLTDSFGRSVESIRISVTQRCNLNCLYCHREGEILDRNTEMTPNEIQRIVSIAASFGIEKVKLTGGEPLLNSAFRIRAIEVRLNEPDNRMVVHHAL